jgi:hypothetical protein
MATVFGEALPFLPHKKSAERLHELAASNESGNALAICYAAPHRPHSPEARGFP